MCWKGVTFLAFGNGAPDIFSSIAGIRQANPELVVGELYGQSSDRVNLFYLNLFLIPLNVVTLNRCRHLRDHSGGGHHLHLVRLQANGASTLSRHILLHTDHTVSVDHILRRFDKDLSFHCIHLCLYLLHHHCRRRRHYIHQVFEQKGPRE